MGCKIAVGLVCRDRVSTVRAHARRGKYMRTNTLPIRLQYSICILVAWHLKKNMRWGMPYLSPFDDFSSKPKYSATEKNLLYSYVLLLF
jgi:hypothetical protein